MSELNQISNSTFKYWQSGKILYGTIKNENIKVINEGVMEFEKMKNLSYDEYLQETKILKIKYLNFLQDNLQKKGYNNRETHE